MLHQSLNLSYLPDFFVALFNVFCGAHNHLLYPVNIFILEEIQHEPSYSTSKQGYHGSLLLNTIYRY